MNSRLLGGCLGVCTAFVSSMDTAAAQAPALVPVQGFVADDGGTPLNGPTVFTFRIYDAANASTALYTEAQTVSVDDGFFTAYLGDVTNLPLTLFRDHAALFVGIQVADDSEASPRPQLATAPYAAVARYCGEADTLEGLSASDFRQVSDPIAWSDLSGVPSALVDGDDNTTYTAGAGLALSGTQFALNASGCSMGQVLKFNGTGWTCSADLDTSNSYTAGAGLALAGNQFALNTSGCSEGYVLKFMAGTWTCSADSNAGTVCNNGQYLDGDGTCKTAFSQTSADARYLALAGGTLTGGLTAPNFQYPSARSRKLNVTAGNFTLTASDDQLTTGSAHQVYYSAGTAPYTGWLGYSLQLPHGAVITGAECHWYDDSATAELTSFDTSIRRRQITGKASENLLRATLDNGVHQDTLVQTQTMLPVANAVLTVDNDNYAYWLNVSFATGTELAGSGVRFYGCSVSYQVSTAGL